MGYKQKTTQNVTVDGPIVKQSYMAGNFVKYNLAVMIQEKKIGNAMHKSSNRKILLLCNSGHQSKSINKTAVIVTSNCNVS